MMSRIAHFALAAGLLVLMMWVGTWLSDKLVAHMQFFLPAPLLGLLGLFMLFVLMRKVPEPVTVMSQSILTHMAVLFVPATVSVVLLKSMLLTHLWPLLLALLTSTLVSMAVTVWLMSWLLRSRRAATVSVDTKR